MSEVNSPATLSNDAVDDFLEVLEDTELWELDEASWAIVDSIVERARAAARAGKEDAFREATADLERSGPRRGNDAGGGAKRKQSAQQRQSKIDLKHELKPPQRTHAGEQSGDSGKGR
ncbi:CATRA system-associated protein [Krasilnikovia sp. MM14-A1259]|uniref:CATRA system-associated protein n=1 Tax=Krasilnikovia sp. MM14-A1259 TaxID=3373539 RepID=UPI003810BB00